MSNLNSDQFARFAEYDRSRYPNSRPMKDTYPMKRGRGIGPLFGGIGKLKPDKKEAERRVTFSLPARADIDNALTEDTRN